MLGALEEEEKRKWTEWVPSLVHAYNCTKSTVTGLCLYYLMFGRDPILPIVVEYGITEPYLWEHDNENYARKLHKHLNWAYKSRP